MIAGDMSKPMQLNKSAIAVVAHVEEHIKVSYEQAIDEMQNEKTKQVLTE
jgi:demethoxyubiquinone hydroxylase (CLK1/Coq7/Cat5 family)